MANTKIIKQKIKAISSIKKITKTMEMVAVSKMRKTVKEAVDIAPYIFEIKNILSKIKTEMIDKSIYFNENKNIDNQELIIIFASNKGLCGSYNTNLYKKTKKIIDENPNIKNAICLGKFSEKIARKLKLNIKLSFIHIEKILHPHQIYKLEKYIRESFINNEYKKIQAVYTNFIKMGVYEPKHLTLYPLKEDLNIYTKDLEATYKTKMDSSKLYTFEPSESELIDELIPKMIKLLLFSMLVESRASENSSRSFAMKRANESAGEMLTSLKISYNKVRQDSITQEIAEISAGSMN